VDLAETEQAASSSFEKLLGESRDLVTERLAAAMAAMLDKADEELVALISGTQERAAQETYQDARKAIGSQRKKLETEFQKFYLKEFRARATRVKDAAQSFAEVETSELKLVGDHDLEETLKFKELAAKLRTFCDEELGALDQRVGVLLGDANLASDGNPFSPQAICDAFQQACHELDAKVQVRDILRKLFDDHVIDEVRSIYKAVNALLVKNAILPRIRYGVSKDKSKRRPAGGAKAGKGKKDAKPGEEEEEDEDDEADAGANIFALLQKLATSGAGLPGLGVGAAPALAPGQIVLQGADLLGALSRIQLGDASAIPGGLPAVAAGAAAAAAGGPADTTNVLRELKTSSFGAGMGQMDAMTLDIVAMLFDQLFDDAKIPIGLKGLVARLQIPMLKVAIADKTFFQKKSHPARQVLNTLGEIALRLPPDFGVDSPLFIKLEAILQQILEGFKDDVAIFETTETQLRAVIADEEQRVQSETRAVAESAQQAENLAVAKTAAEEEIRPRVQGHKLPGPVLEFLIQHWLRLLLLIHAKSGTEGAEWKDALEAMDDLIWSVEAKKTPEDRRKLAAMVPKLVKRITAGLQSLGAEEQVRTALFAELMTYHTEILHPKEPAAGAAPAAKGAEPAGKAPAAASATLDFTAAVTVKNPYGGGEVKVSATAAIDPPEDLEMGDWIEFRSKAAEAVPQAKKLLFVPPKKTRYIFSDRRGQDILELTRGEIVRRLRSGEAVRLDGEPEEPLFDRIMNGLVGKLSAPATPAA